MTWQDSDPEREHLERMLENERRQIAFASVIRLMDSLIKGAWDPDEARLTAITQVRKVMDEMSL